MQFMWYDVKKREDILNNKTTHTNIYKCIDR